MLKLKSKILILCRCNLHIQVAPGLSEKRIVNSEYSYDKSQSIHRMNEIFDEEKQRQNSLIPRVKNIEVLVKNIKPSSDLTLIMKKLISTPYNCAQHISELYTKRTIVSLLNDSIYWDMHRPLEDSCTLVFKHFTDDNPIEVNKIFWRSCSFLLGMVIQRAFKDSIQVHLHSWPKPNYKTGSFVYDAQLCSLENWEPTEGEIRSLTAIFWKIKDSKSKFERLAVSCDIAKQIFENNPFKISQIQSIESSAKDTKIILYRFGNHIDYSIGPMLPDTSCFGRVSVASVHKIESSIPNLYRFQGVALPYATPLHFFAYKILIDRAKKLNTLPHPL